MNSQSHTPPKPATLGRQVALINLLTAGAALLVASLIMMAYQFFSLRSSLVEDVRVQARIIGDNSAAALVFDDRRASEETLLALAGSPTVAAATVFTTNGKELASFRRDPAVALSAPSPALIQAHHQFSLRHLDVLENIELDLDRRKIGFVVIRVTLDQLYGRLAIYALLMMAVAAGSLGVAYFLVARMRHAVRKAEAHLDYLAHVDSVTGLPNRHTFNHRLAFALNKVEQFGGAVGLLLLDLDNFKIVNDTLGHHAGDKLLKMVSLRLADALRDADTVCRIGGDEFAVIVESKGDASECEWVANKLLAALAEPFALEKHEIYVTGSMGLSLFPRDAMDIETLTRNADTAMYQAKSKGKNGMAKFFPEMDLRAQKRMSLESSLRKAVERDELVLHYQPMLDAKSDSIHCVEALLRWNHPELGLVSPNDFIPVAEESGLIVPIGQWVLRTACLQAAAWRDAGMPDITVAVNLSARQTKDTGLVDQILDALRTAGITASQLELEITETVLMDNVLANEEMLLRLQTEGIRLAIDDFGTGYSSMAYLKRFPIDQLKIDRTFVRDIPGDGDDEAITTAIIAMAHSLGLTVVAEGVETAEQLAYLRAAGCDTIQGFYFARPMPAGQVTQFMLQKFEDSRLSVMNHQKA